MNRLAAYVLAALGFGIYGAVTNVDRDESGAIVDAGTLDAFEMRLGSGAMTGMSKAGGEGLRGDCATGAVAALMATPCSADLRYQ